jgi:hypothetical protein
MSIPTPDQDIKVKVRRHSQAASMLDQCMKQSFVIEDGVAAFRIGKKPGHTLGIAGLAPKMGNDEVNIRRSKLHPTVWLYYLHRGFRIVNGFRPFKQIKFQRALGIKRACRWFCGRSATTVCVEFGTMPMKLHASRTGIH